jgi:hypothetical protein
MPFRRGEGAAANAFLSARGLGGGPRGPLSEGVAIRQANAAERYEAAGQAYTKPMLRAHFFTPERPGRTSQAARGVIPGMTPRQQVHALPKGVQKNPNNTMSASGLRRVEKAETALRAFVREGQRSGDKAPRVQITVQDNQGHTRTLGSKYGYSAQYIQSLIDAARASGSHRIWQSAIASLLAGASGYGLSLADLNLNTISLVSV